MVARELFCPILEDESLTRGLGDEEARVLIDWLVDRTERAHQRWGESAQTRAEVQQSCRRARAFGRFVYLWCYEGDRPGACQLAATERFSWPLPKLAMDPYDLMRRIVFWEQ